MKHLSRVVAAFLLFVAVPCAAEAWDRGEVIRSATLPPGAEQPEGFAVDGLLFPASLVRHRGFLYVTNLSLDLRDFGHPTVDPQWAAAVKRHTISRIRARIPPTHVPE